MGIFNFFKRERIKISEKDKLEMFRKNAQLWFDVAKEKAKDLDVAIKALEFYAEKNDKNARTAKKALKLVRKKAK